jgi:hypothetical protein
MTKTLPLGQVVTQPVSIHNFMGFQSAKLAVTNTSVPLTFTAINSSQNVAYHLSNTGTKGCYVTAATSAAVAVASTSTPTPTTSGSGTLVSTGIYIAAGSVQIIEFPNKCISFAAVCGGSDTTTLEVTIGFGS